MKNLEIGLITVLIMVIGSILFLDSCKKEEGETFNANQEFGQSKSYKNESIKIFNNSLESKKYLPSNYDIQISIISFNLQNSKKIISIANQIDNSINENNFVALALFPNNVELNNIQAESSFCAILYTLKSDTMKANLFTSSNGIIQNNEYFQGSASVIDINTLYDFSHTFFPKNSEFGLILNSSNVKNYSNNYFAFNNKLKRSITENNTSYKEKPGGEDSGVDPDPERSCSYPCPPSDGICVATEKTGYVVQYNCMEGCGISAANALAIPNEFNLNQKDDELLHIFKDEYLGNSQELSKYIDIYYRLGRKIEINPTNAYKTLKVTQNHILPIIQKIRGSGDQSDTLLNGHFIEIIDYLSYMNNFANTEGKVLISQIKNDIIQYRYITKGEFLNL